MFRLRHCSPLIVLLGVSGSAQMIQVLDQRFGHTELPMGGTMTTTPPSLRPRSTSLPTVIESTEQRSIVGYKVESNRYNNGGWVVTGLNEFGQDGSKDVK